jgi:hypothetical protein
MLQRDSQSLCTPPLNHNGLLRAGSLSKANHNGPSIGMLSKMRTIMKRQQCIDQHEALFNCFNGSNEQNARQSSKCSQYMEALTYCQLQTQQHNYPINTAYLF